MLVSKILFNLLAVALFVIIFFKMIKKNDTTYVSILIAEAIGIGINFIEIIGNLYGSVVLEIIEYVLAVIIPIIVIIMEAKGINFSEIISIGFAHVLIFLGNNKLAKEILVNLVTKYPGESYFGHKLLAKIYEKEGGMRRAIDEYVSAIDINKKDYDSYYKIAELLNDLGKKDEAIEMLNTLIKNKPDYYEASNLLGDLLCSQERFKEAVSVYTEALKYKPDDFELYYSLGIAYTRLNDFQSAKECYEKAADINHRLYNAYYSLGQIALIQKDLELAEKYFTESLYDELEGKSYYQLARIYIIKNQKDKAITFINKAIELEPELLKKAVKEKIFEPIKQYFTVSVKLDETPEKEEKLTEEELSVQKHLEETNSLIENINENTERKKVNDKVDEIFSKELLKKSETTENQKELGSN